MNLKNCFITLKFFSYINNLKDLINELKKYK